MKIRYPLYVLLAVALLSTCLLVITKKDYKKGSFSTTTTLENTVSFVDTGELLEGETNIYFPTSTSVVKEYYLTKGVVYKLQITAYSSSTDDFYSSLRYISYNGNYIELIGEYNFSSTSSLFFDIEQFKNHLIILVPNYSPAIWKTNLKPE